MKIETNTREDFEKQNVFLDESHKTVNTRQVQGWSSAFKLINRSIIFLSVSRLGLDNLFLLLLSLSHRNSNLKIFNKNFFTFVFLVFSEL